MYNIKIFTIFLMVAGYCSATTVQSNYYEEALTYSSNPQCRPTNLNKGIRCSNIGSTIEIAGGLYDNWALHYIPFASAYYAARVADAMGYQDNCLTNKTFLQNLDLISLWSGPKDANAVDFACGSKRLIQRKCTNADANWPFICHGVDGSSPTFARRLENYSYVGILQGSNNRWVLFVNCWNAKTPQNPNAVETATSFMVLSLDPVLTAADRASIVYELRRRGFNTDLSNIIEFDYRTTKC